MPREHQMHSIRARFYMACCGLLIVGAGWLSVALSAQQPVAAEPAAEYVWPTPTAAELRLVKGALDIHVHLDPDSVGEHSTQAPRQLDVIDMALRAKELGMRGFVIKQHYDQSAQLAYITRKEVPGIEVYGGVGQNLTLGGVNAEAVYHMAEVKGGWGRIVWLPTWDAENNVRTFARESGSNVTRPYVSVVKQGKVTAAVKQVIAAVKTIKTRDSNGELVLETGHSSAAEALLIVRQAQQQGIKRIVVTHAFGNPVFMSIAQMQEAVRLGAMIEFVAAYAMGPDPTFTPAVYADAMRQVGVDNVIISTDFGQQGRPLPPDALALFAGMMLKQGFTEQQLHTMMAVNPARVMGLPAAPLTTATTFQPVLAAKLTRLALQNAAPVAGLLLTTEVMIA